MSERLKRIQGMAKRYNKLGVVKDETVASIDAAVIARNIPAVRDMTGGQIKEVRTRYNMSQAALALTTGMSLESVSKWERTKANQTRLLCGYSTSLIPKDHKCSWHNMSVRII